MTVKEIFETQIPDGLKEDPSKAKSINAIYQFNVSGDGGGNWYVDLKSDPPEVKEGSNDAAQCTITVGDEDFVKIVTGELNAQMAFMSGKIKIAGDMSLAMKLGSVLGTK